MNTFKMCVFYYCKHKFNMDQTPLLPLLWFFVMPTQRWRWRRRQPCFAQAQPTVLVIKCFQPRTTSKIGKLIPAQWLAATTVFRSVQYNNNRTTLVPLWQQDFFLHIFCERELLDIVCYWFIFVALLVLIKQPWADFGRLYLNSLSGAQMRWKASG